MASKSLELNDLYKLNPIAQIGLALGIIALILALAYFVLYSGQLDELKAAEAEEVSLKGDFEVKAKAGKAKSLRDAPVHSNWPICMQTHAGRECTPGSRPGALAVQLGRLTPGPGSPVSTTCIERAMNEHDANSVAH